MATLSFEDNLSLVLMDIARFSNDTSKHINTAFEQGDRDEVDNDVDYQNRRFLVGQA